MLLDGLGKGDCRYILFDCSSVCIYRILNYRFRLGKEVGSLKREHRRCKGKH